MSQPRVLAALPGPRRRPSGRVTCLPRWRAPSAAAWLAVVWLALGMWLGLARPAQAAPPPDCPPPLTEADVQAAVRRAPPPADRGFLWRLERDGQVSWLYGTLHVGRLDWLLPGPQLVQALRASDLLALEVDPSDAAVEAEVAQGMRADPAAPAMAALLQARMRQRAEAECAAPQLEGLRPEWQAMLLGVLAARRLGLEPGLGSEALLVAMAGQLKLPLFSLEDARTQLRAIHLDDPAERDEMITRALDDLDNGRGIALLRRLVDAWAVSEWPEVANYAAWCQCLETPAERIYLRRLLDDRNPGLAAGIERQHAAGRRVFAAVGALHMTGAQGLPVLLAQRGFRVEPVALRPR